MCRSRVSATAAAAGMTRVANAADTAASGASAPDPAASTALAKPASATRTSLPPTPPTKAAATPTANAAAATAPAVAVRSTAAAPTVAGTSPPAGLATAATAVGASQQAALTASLASTQVDSLLKSGGLLLPVRTATENWARARKTIASDSDWATWLNQKRAAVDHWFGQPRDRADLVAGLPGACVAALGTFLPCYLFTILPAPYFKKSGKLPSILAFVDGVTAAAVAGFASPSSRAHRPHLLGAAAPELQRVSL